MTNGEKILIAILLGITIIMFFVFNNNFNKIEDSKEQEVDTILDYMNENKKEEAEKNQISENEVESNNVIQNEVENEIKNEVIGKEEQESKQENVGLTNEQKAIKLAQDEWGISVSSYDFEAELQSDGTYRVTVRSNDSNRTTVAIYTVDVENETVTE